MTTNAEKRQILRDRLAKDEILVVPGTGDALGARLIQEAGFEACYMSGYAVEATYGMPDVGLLTLNEVAGRIADINNATDLPLIADADAGYGNVVNVQRMVKEFERAGAAAIQLEDQTLPKKCGSMAGRRVVSTAEMVGKIKAAVDARTDENFQIIGRTDIYVTEGLDAMCERLAAYYEAGADMLMAMGPYTPEVVREFVKRAPGPVAYLNSESFTMPMMPSDELQKIGVKLLILPLALTMSTIHASRRTLQHIKNAKADTREYSKEWMATWAECNSLLGFEEINRIENKFGAA